MKDRAEKTSSKNQIHKKWWFWLIIAIILFSAFGGKEEESGIKFHVSKARNDVTGNFRVCTIAENIQMQDHAIDYYKKYFKDDKEIHVIINFNYKTTTKILRFRDFNILDVVVYDYVDKEEHDAKKLCTGHKLAEYFVHIDTGEIEEID